MPPTPTRKRPARPTATRRELITRAELARRKGCTRGAVTRACQGALAAAVVGKAVDAAHSAVQQWLADDAHVTTPGTGPELTAFQVVALEKRRAELERLRSRNERDAGRLIARGLVQQSVIGHLRSLHRRLLSDAPKTIALRLLGAIRSGATAEQASALVGELIGADLSRAKTDTAAALRRCRAGDNPPAVTPLSAGAERSRGQELRALRDELSARLRGEGAPKVVQVVLAAVGHAASGQKWDPLIVAQIMTARPAIEAEASRVIGNILTAHVEHVVRELTLRKEPLDATADIP